MEPRTPMTDPTLWTQVEELFPDLLELPAHERDSFLASHCEGQPRLREELESLLAASDAPSVLDVPSVLTLTGTANDPGENAPPLAPGTRLGQWRLVRMLGYGGMGEVYLGERASGGFEQTAAIKRLRTDALQHADRFDSERQILAQLDHPNIAHLLGGGIADDGSAWMAMEYVQGDTITTYCRSHVLDLPARLALFTQVCEAVAYAHTKLIVHRDLKPANILVTAQGQVKLLDFGIAKLLGGDGDVTRSAPFTPDHAAPEQLEGSPATTAVDVYALGILLYEMLSGRRPWSLGNTPVSQAVDRLLREQPPTPSRAASEQIKAPVPPDQLRGDMDAIVCRCLRKTPSDRYSSVEALLADLSRHNAHKPVLAREGNTGYVLRLWLRRHRIGVMATTLVFVALLGGLGLAVWQARVAERAAVRAERVKELVLSAFREQDPLSRPGSEGRSPKQLIASAIATIDRELADDRMLHAELLDDFGEIQGNLGDIDGAGATLQRALVERRALLGDNHLAVAESRRKLAQIKLYQGDQESVLALATRNVATLDAVGQGQSAEAARNKLLMAVVMVMHSDRERALSLDNEATATLEATLGRDHPDTIDALLRTGQTLTQMRRDAEAGAITGEAIKRIERSQGTESPRLIYALSIYADALLQDQRLQEADAAYARSIALARRWLEPVNNVLSNSLARRGSLKAKQGQLEEALDLFQQSETATPTGSTSSRGNLLAARGRVHLKLGRFDEGEHDLREAFDLRRKQMGDDAGLTWFSASLWGSALRLQGKPEQAEQVQRDALERVQKIIGKDGYQTTLLLDELVDTLKARGGNTEAIALARQALSLTLVKYPPGHELSSGRRIRLAEALAGAAEPALRNEAVRMCDQSLAYAQQGEPSEYGAALLSCAEIELSLGDPTAARTLANQALATLPANSTTKATTRIGANVLLAKIDGRSGKPKTIAKTAH